MTISAQAACHLQSITFKVVMFAWIILFTLFFRQTAMATDVDDTSHPAYRGQKSLPYINTWLVCGTFDNGDDGAGMDTDWVDEATVTPAPGAAAGTATWTYFDDRLFSRNYDDYQDFFSYFKTKLKSSVTARIAYAHAYIYSPKAQSMELRVGADRCIDAFVNGERVIRSTKDQPDRDAVSAPVRLLFGWNRLLIKVGNRQNGPLGFYARLCDEKGDGIEELTYATADNSKPFAISTTAMADISTGDVPTAWRQWPFVGLDAGQFIRPGSEQFGMCKPFLQLEQIPRSSAFSLQASGGIPPYTWRLLTGKLPSGMQLTEQGLVVGTPEVTCVLGKYSVSVQAQDSTGLLATKDVTLDLQERPNAWYEQAGMVALIHAPEKLNDREIPLLAQTMKRQGYQLGMVISYNNGDSYYRYPSMFDPVPRMGDVTGRYKVALEENGIRFGMYFGMNEAAGNKENGKKNGTILMLEEALDKFHPKALFFDWAGLPCFSLDSLYSMVKSKYPETLIVLNGMPTLGYGDWDVICMEALGASGSTHWDMKPFTFPWPKYPVVESWRHMNGESAMFGSQDIQVDPVEFQKIAIAMIGEGIAADIDHTGKSSTKESALEDSRMFQSHVQMGEWASPPQLPALYSSYTKVQKGPLLDVPWGYCLSAVDGSSIYLHFTKNPWGKSGLPGTDRLALDLPGIQVKRALWMNTNTVVPWSLSGNSLEISLKELSQDPISTIVRLELTTPYVMPPAENISRQAAKPPGQVGPKNLALGRPAQLLSPDATRTLTPSVTRFARLGVDGLASTSACGAFTYDWTFQVDLEAQHDIGKMVIQFGSGYATSFDLLASSNGTTWATIMHVSDCTGGIQEFQFENLTTRYIRVLALTPNAIDQPGGQMQIAEVEIYEK